jgi:hypothetical protein
MSDTYNSGLFGEAVGLFCYSYRRNDTNRKLPIDDLHVFVVKNDETIYGKSADAITNYIRSKHVGAVFIVTDIIQLRKFHSKNINHQIRGFATICGRERDDYIISYHGITRKGELL